MSRNNHQPSTWSNLRHSMSAEDSAAADGDSEDESPRPAITKSSLRRRHASPLPATEKLTGPGAAAAAAASSSSSKRQKTSTAGDYVHVNGTSHSAGSKQTDGSKEKSSKQQQNHRHHRQLVSLKYRSSAPVHNPSPAFRDSEIFVTGQGLWGQLATPLRKTHKSVPIKVGEALDPLEEFAIVQIACGPTHCVALTSEGSMLSWGSNLLGALGRDTGRSSNSNSKGNGGEGQDDAGGDEEADEEIQCKYTLEQQYVPVRESAVASGKDTQIDYEAHPGEVDMGTFFDGVSVVKVAAGSHKSFALTSDGFVYAWGAFVTNFEWQAPNMMIKLAHRPQPSIILGLRDIIDIAAGNDFLIALTKAGDVICLGHFADGAPLGPANWFNMRSWGDIWGKVQTGLEAPPLISAVWATPVCAFALDANGQPWAWGENTHNKLGTRRLGSKYPPLRVRVTKVKQIVGNYKVTVFVTHDGEAYIVGDTQEALPHHDQMETFAPSLKVDKDLTSITARAGATYIKHPAKMELGGLVTCAAVGGGMDAQANGMEGPVGHVVLIMDDGLGWVWGNNREGQCGQGWSRRTLTAPYELRIKTAGARPIEWAVAGDTWTFFAVPLPEVGWAVDGPEGKGTSSNSNDNGKGSGSNKARGKAHSAGAGRRGSSS